MARRVVKEWMAKVIGIDPNLHGHHYLKFALEIVSIASSAVGQFNENVAVAGAGEFAGADQILSS